MMRYAIWTGDTTTHGGILTEGEPTNTWGEKNSSHNAVLVGHKFWCPTCQCWSKFIEGTNRYRVQGKQRVLEGHSTSCGTVAIHRLGFSYRIEETTESFAASKIRRRNQLRVQARKNQQTDGGYSHRFTINNHSHHPVEYLIYSDGNLLDIGTATKSKFSCRTSSVVNLSESKKIHLAIKAPRPALK